MVFDQLLYDFSLDDSRWSARLANLAQTSVQADAIGNTVVYQCTDGGADAGADVVSYDGAAQDVRNRFGELFAVSFTDFPIT